MESAIAEVITKLFIVNPGQPEHLTGPISRSIAPSGRQMALIGPFGLRGKSMLDFTSAISNPRDLVPKINFKKLDKNFSSIIPHFLSY